jgi:hypothetical protein
MTTTPAAVRAKAPERRFAEAERRGRAEVEVEVEELVVAAPVCAIPLLKASKLVKYRALPNPVRITEGSVPRQSCSRPRGPPRDMSRSVAERLVCCACCRRVFSRSAGWRRAAETMPVVSPAAKCTAGKFLVSCEEVQEGPYQGAEWPWAWTPMPS